MFSAAVEAGYADRGHRPQWTVVTPGGQGGPARLAGAVEAGDAGVVDQNVEPAIRVVDGTVDPAAEPRTRTSRP
jgi:hypothetical protein